MPHRLLQAFLVKKHFQLMVLPVSMIKLTKEWNIITKKWSLEPPYLKDFGHCCYLPHLAYLTRFDEEQIVLPKGT